jgi:trk system potassium uptake protein TrkH
MIDFRPIVLVIGFLLTTLSAGMILPAAVDGLAGNPDWQVFAVSAGATLFIGVAMILTSRTGGTRLNTRQAFLLTTLSWVVLTAFAALPFKFSNLNLSYTDAFFEAMSGITTTGSTVMVSLDQAPPGILVWRAVLQWLGGIGIIIMAIAVMPMLRVGGMQLFRVEAFETDGKALPRAAQISTAISLVYLVLTVIWAAGFWFAGMSGFDAILHAMTTIATGGFSTYDTSIGHFNSGLIDWITTTGMLVGALPFLLYLKAVQGDLRPLMRDAQVRGFIIIVASVVLITASWLWLNNGESPVQALRYAAFNVISIITGTGYTTSQFDTWGSFSMPIFLIIMVIGGCAGSTTCGIKIFRFQVLLAATRRQLKHIVRPHGVFIPYYNHRPVSDDVITSVLSFFFLYGLSLAVLAIALGLLGLDFVTAISGATTAISNVGPGMGPIIGPAGNFSTLPDSAKWLLSSGMLLGRLELFTVMVLFTRSFWRG